MYFKNILLRQFNRNSLKILMNPPVSIRLILTENGLKHSIQFDFPYRKLFYLYFIYIKKV